MHLPMRILKQPRPDPASRQRWRLDISYEGTDFRGWAQQPGERTVEGTIHGSLVMICASMARQLGLPGDELVVSRLVCAGRTDAGVHARGQVAHVDVDPQLAQALDVDWLRYRFAGLLPEDVVVRRVQAVASSFDARFSALSRRYQYRISDHLGTRDALSRREVTAHVRPLDVTAMNDAAQEFIGTHDFAGFCKAQPFGTTVRQVFECSWARDDLGHAVLTIQADAFCRSMVRTLVGAMVAVGEGRWNRAQIGDVVSGRQRQVEIQVMPAKGLTLMEVAYPPESDWALRQQITRARRRLEPRCSSSDIDRYA